MPKWLIYSAYYADTDRSLPLLRLLSGYLDIHPQLAWKIFLLRMRPCKQLLIGHIHIPKTGGSYVSSLQDTFPHISFSHTLIRRERSDKFCPLGLMPIKETKLRSFFLFSIVRNPLTFFVSYYHHAGGFEPRYRNSNHYDFYVAQKGFHYLINTVLDRTDKWPSRKFLFPQLFNQQGECIVDWVNRQEQLDRDLYTLAKTFGFILKAKERKRYSKIQKPYSEFYTEKLVERLCAVYRREMRLFGYDGFDTITPDLETKPMEKSRLKYDYVKDRLFLDGKIFDE